MVSPIRAVLVAGVLALCACDNSATTADMTIGGDDLALASLGGDGGVGCGAGECAVGGDEICCLESATRYCAPVSACSSGTPAYCDGPEDCTGAACCLPSGTNAIVCQQQCVGTVFCHADGDCPTAQPRCCPDATTGYRVCGAAGGC